MVKKTFPIVWTKRSQLQLHVIFKFINEDSPANAKKVVDDILSAADKAAINPEL